MQIFACALNTQTIIRNLNITYLAKIKGPPLHGEGSDCRQSPGQKSGLFLCFSYPQFFFVELLYQEKSVCYPPDSFILSIPFVV